MKKQLIILLALFFPLILLAKGKPLNDYDITHLVPSEKRIVTSLSGTWDMSTDGEKTWTSSTIPSSHYTDDAIVFKRTIKIDKDLLHSNAWHLYFLGVNNQIDIYFNEEFIGRYYGYGAPFIVDIPSRAIVGASNTLKIVASQAKYNEKLSRQLSFYTQKNYVGILRDVLLVGSGSLWIENVLPKAEVNSNYTTSTVDLKMLISADRIANAIGVSEEKEQDSTDTAPNEKNIKGLYLKIRVINPETSDTSRYYVSEKFALESERTKEMSMKIRIDNPQLWSIKKPHLYKFQIELHRDGQLVDDYVLSYGIKDFKTNGTSFMLNGKSIEIKGCQYFEDYYHTDFSISAKRIRKDLKLIELLGCNTIMTGNHAVHPLLASLADSMGLLLMPTMPVSCIPEKLIDLDEIRVSVSNITHQMLTFYQKNTSVVAYCISDCLDENATNTHTFNAETAKQIRAISDKMIFKNVLLNSESVNVNNVDFVTFYHASATSDFYALNENVRRLKATVKNKPVLFYYGALCNPKNHNGYADPLSIDYQAYNISQCYKIADKNNMAGNIVKSFNDYRLESPILLTNYYDRELSTTGLFSRNRKFRISFNTLQALYTDRTEPLLNSGSLSDDSLVPVSFMVLTLLMIALLFLLLNRQPRFREYFVRSLSKPYNFYADIRDQRIISSMHTIILALFISLSVAIYLVSIFYINKDSESLNFLLSAAIPFTAWKNTLFNMVWHPQLLMLSFTAIFFTKLLLIAVAIKLLAMLLRAKVYYGDCFTMAVWSANPLILLMLLNVFSQRVMANSPLASAIFFVIFALLILLFIYRLFRCFAVVFEKSSISVYAIGIFVLFLLALIPILYYYFNYNVFPYFQYILEVL